MAVNYSIKYEENTCTISDLTLTKEEIFILPNSRNHNQITKLIIQNSVIPLLSEDILKSFKNLEYLKAESVGIEEISENAFVENKFLRKIFLHGNRINEIPKNTFNRNSRLRILYLNENEITLLPTEIFYGLENLKKLNLGENRLTKLSKKLFRDLKNLEVININHNRLIDLNVKQILPQLPNLQEFTIRDNQFSVGQLMYILSEFHNKNIILATCLSTNCDCNSVDGKRLQGIEFVSQPEYDGLWSRRRIEKLEKKIKLMQQQENERIQKIIDESLMETKIKSLEEKVDVLQNSLSFLAHYFKAQQEQKVKEQDATNANDPSNNTPSNNIQVEDNEEESLEN